MNVSITNGTILVPESNISSKGIETGIVNIKSRIITFENWKDHEYTRKSLFDKNYNKFKYKSEGKERKEISTKSLLDFFKTIVQ